jgi:hypothetical protein
MMAIARPVLPSLANAPSHPRWHHPFPERGMAETSCPQPDRRGQPHDPSALPVPIAKHKGRVLVGLSLTAPPDKTEIIKVAQPNSSQIPERMAAVVYAHRMGLRTYGMLCPLLPGIADGAGDILKPIPPIRL